MIKNPMKPGDPVYDMAFNLYAMEKEGLLMTHQGCLNRLCQIMRSSYLDPNDKYEFARMCEEAGIDWALTPEDLDYIYAYSGIYPNY